MRGQDEGKRNQTLSYATKVHRDIGGDSITLDPNGKIVFGNVTFSISASGKLVITGLPTADPLAAGQLWSDSGALTVSSGA